MGGSKERRPGGRVPSPPPIAANALLRRTRGTVHVVDQLQRELCHSSLEARASQTRQHRSRGIHRAFPPIDRCALRFVEAPEPVRHRFPVNRRMTTTIRRRPTMPVGRYPQPRLYGQAGIAPKRSRIRRIRRIKPTTFLLSASRSLLLRNACQATSRLQGESRVEWLLHVAERAITPVLSGHSIFGREGGRMLDRESRDGGGDGESRPEESPEKPRIQSSRRESQEVTAPLHTSGYSDESPSSTDSDRGRVSSADGNGEDSTDTRSALHGRLNPIGGGE
jgi:hypothetical protein